MKIAPPDPALVVAECKAAWTRLYERTARAGAEDARSAWERLSKRARPS